MVRHFLILILLFIVFLLSPVPNSQAGQVLTPSQKNQAAKAVKNEMSLDTQFSDNTIAVLYFVNSTGNEKLDPFQKGLAIMLITDLAKLSDLEVVERTSLHAIVQELNLSASGIVESETGPRLGRLLGARYLVGGTIDKGTIKPIGINSDLLEVLEPDFLEVPENNIIGSPGVEGRLEELISMEKNLLFQILEILDYKLSKSQEETLRYPMSTKIESLHAFFKGIDSSDAGNYLEAAQFYEEALKEDPNLTQAKDALIELNDLGLVNNTTLNPVPGTVEIADTDDENTAGVPITRGLLQGLRSKVSQNTQLIPTQSTKRTITPGEITAIEDRNSKVDIDW